MTKSQPKLIDRRRIPIFIHGELDDMPLKAEAFRVYAHLVRRSDKTGASFPGLQEIGDVCFGADYDYPDTRKKHAIAAIKELVEKGLITKEERRKNGFLTSNAYVILEVSQQPVWGGEEAETPAPQQSVSERAEWRNALMPILWQHNNIRLMNAGHHRHVKDLSTKFLAAGITVADVVEWYQKEWKAHHWKGKKGEPPLPSDVLAGVAAYVERRGVQQTEQVTIVAMEDEE